MIRMKRKLLKGRSAGLLRMRLAEICGDVPDVREGACLCLRGRVALHFWVGSLNS